MRLWSWEIDKLFQLKLYNGCKYFFNAVVKANPYQQSGLPGMDVCTIEQIYH